MLRRMLNLQPVYWVLRLRLRQAEALVSLRKDVAGAEAERCQRG